MISRKLLVTNADDFGLTPDVNEGIVDAHRRGILTATTLMANGGAFDDAVRLALETPSLDVGCHLVLVGGLSVLDSKKALPATVPRFLAALARRAVHPYEEMAAQVTRILNAGIRPTHLDTHKHTHLAPPVRDAVARVAEVFGIRWVRCPFDFAGSAAQAPVPAGKEWTSRALYLTRRRFRRALERRGCRLTDHFAGFRITGRFGTRELVGVLEAIPPGTTELMCHPGRLGEGLRLARTRLKESRERELDALVSQDVRGTLERLGIELTNYRALSS